MSQGRLCLHPLTTHPSHWKQEQMPKDVHPPCRAQMVRGTQRHSPASLEEAVSVDTKQTLVTILLNPEALSQVPLYNFSGLILEPKSRATGRGNRPCPQMKTPNQNLWPLPSAHPSFRKKLGSFPRFPIHWPRSVVSTTS